MNKFILIFVGALILLLLVAGYFYLWFPFYGLGLVSLEELRNYYSVAAAFVTVITAFIGVILGWFYYFHKLNNDDENRKNERKKSQIDSLLKELRSYDESINKIFDKEYDGPGTLRAIRSKISRGFDIVYMIIGKIHDEGFASKDDVLRIIEVNSFVDKCLEIMHKEYDEIKEFSFSELKEVYVDKINDAMRVCFFI